MKPRIAWRIVALLCVLFSMTGMVDRVLAQEPAKAAQAVLRVKAAERAQYPIP